MGDILQEDALSNPNSPIAKCSIEGAKTNVNPEIPWMDLLDNTKRVTTKYSESDSSRYSTSEFSYNEAKVSYVNVNATPNRSRVWCMSKEACSGLSPENSP